MSLYDYIIHTFALSFYALVCMQSYLRATKFPLALSLSCTLSYPRATEFHTEAMGWLRLAGSKNYRSQSAVYLARWTEHGWNENSAPIVSIDPAAATKLCASSRSRRWGKDTQTPTHMIPLIVGHRMAVRAARSQAAVASCKGGAQPTLHCFDLFVWGVPENSCQPADGPFVCYYDSLKSVKRRSWRPGKICYACKHKFPYCERSGQKDGLVDIGSICENKTHDNSDNGMVMGEQNAVVVAHSAIESTERPPSLAQVSSVRDVGQGRALIELQATAYHPCRTPSGHASWRTLMTTKAGRSRAH